MEMICTKIAPRSLPEANQKEGNINYGKDGDHDIWIIDSGVLYHECN
jgi:hypothetical protein